MSYNLRAYWEGENHNGVIDRLEIKELNFSGSALEITKTQGFSFSHQEITSDNNNGYLNPTFNKILMGVLEFYIWGHDTDTKSLIEDVKTGESKQFLIEWKNGNNPMWFGFASGRIISKPESEKYLSTIQFRDFEVLKTQTFTQSDNRQTIIKTIADILSGLGHNISAYSGAVLQTFTSWQAQGTTLSDDFLNQVYIDTIQLREYGRLGDESDTSISLYEALRYVCAPQLLIYQMNGAFNVVQLSAYDDAENVQRADYYLNGTQVSRGTFDLTQQTFGSVSLGTPIIVQDSENASYPSIQRLGVEYDHKSLSSGINVPSTVLIETPSEKKYIMPVRLSGDESISFSAENYSKMSIPFAYPPNNEGQFEPSDVSTNTIRLSVELNLYDAVRFISGGTLPGGLSESTTYYVKTVLAVGSEYDYTFSAIPYGVEINLTSQGSGTNTLIYIKDLPNPTGQYSLHLGKYFFDSGVGRFIESGFTYTGMATNFLELSSSNIDLVNNRININSGFLEGQTVQFRNTGGALPSGIDENTTYYVLNPLTNSFQLSESYGGSPITIASTGSGIHFAHRTTNFLNLSDSTQYTTAEYVGALSFYIENLPEDQTLDLILRLLPSKAIQEGVMDDEFLDQTFWENSIVQFIDPSNPSSTSILYQMSQDSGSGSEVLQLPAVRYGDGPFNFSRSAYRTSTNLEDITTGWKRRGQSGYVGFEELLLKEVMDTQRSRPSKISANVIGDYSPRTILLYDSKKFAYVGGAYKSRWYPTLVEINIQEGTDTLTELKRVDPSGASGVIVTNPDSTQGITEGEADARYLRIVNNLADLTNVSTARDNLGLGTNDSPTFNGLTVDSLVIQDEIRDLQSDVISNYLEIQSLFDTKVEIGALFPDGDAQALGSGDAVTFLTVNTGQGNNELYGMDQDVKSTDSPTFDSVVLSNQADNGTKALRADREVNSGNGLTGGGSLTSDRTLTMGTPSTITIGGSNSVTSSSHSHEIDLSGRTITISNDSDSVITFSSNTQNLGANRTWVPTISDHGNGQRGVLNIGAQTIYGRKSFNDVLYALDDVKTANFSSYFTTNPTGWEIKQNGEADFRTLRIDELVAKAFTADVAQALAGTDILTKSVGKLYDSFVVPSIAGTVTITVEDLEGLEGLQVFESGDHVRVRVVDSRSGLSVIDVYGTVSNYSDNSDGTQDWTLTITYAGASNSAVGKTVNKGSIILGYGTSGDYYIERTVLDRNSGTDFSKVPYDRIIKWSNTVSGSPRPGDADTVLTVVNQSGNLANLTTTYSDVTGFGYFSDNAFFTGDFKVGYLDNASNPDSNADFFLYDSGNLTAKLSSLNLTISGSDVDLASAVVELQSDLISIYLDTEGAYSGIQFLSGQLILSTDQNGKVATVRLDSTGDFSEIALKSDYFNFQSNDIVIKGDPDLTGSVEAKIALGANADNITLSGTEVGFIATGAGYIKSYIDANNYIRIDNTGIDFNTEKFTLTTSSITIDSDTTTIQLSDATDGRDVTLNASTALPTHQIRGSVSGSFSNVSGWTTGSGTGSQTVLLSETIRQGEIVSYSVEFDFDSYDIDTNAKIAIYLELIEEGGSALYESTIRFIELTNSDSGTNNIVISGVFVSPFNFVPPSGSYGIRLYLKYAETGGGEFDLTNIEYDVEVNNREIYINKGGFTARKDNDNFISDTKIKGIYELELPIITSLSWQSLYPYRGQAIKYDNGTSYVGTDFLGNTSTIKAYQILQIDESLT